MDEDIATLQKKWETLGYYDSDFLFNFIDFAVLLGFVAAAVFIPNGWLAGLCLGMAIHQSGRLSHEIGHSAGLFRNRAPLLFLNLWLFGVSINFMRHAVSSFDFLVSFSMRSAEKRIDTHTLKLGVCREGHRLSANPFSFSRERAIASDEIFWALPFSNARCLCYAFRFRLGGVSSDADSSASISANMAAISSGNSASGLSSMLV